MARPYSRADIKAPSKKPCNIKGHAKLARKNIRSTRLQYPTPDLPVTSDPPQAKVTRTKTIHITVVEPSDFLVTDLTGCFPTIYSRGYNYIILCYIYDTNGNIVRPMKPIHPGTKIGRASCQDVLY